MNMSLLSQSLLMMPGTPAEEPVPPTEPARYVDASVVGPGLIGFILFIFMCVAVFLLWRSMTKQLTKIDFDEPGGTRPVNSPFTAENRPVSSTAPSADAVGTPGTPPKGPGAA